MQVLEGENMKQIPLLAKFINGAALIVLIAVSPLVGKDTKPTPMELKLEEYVQAAKSRPIPLQGSEGSLYVDAGPNWNLYDDWKARRVNDLVTIRVSENTAASSTANTQTGRKSSMEGSVSNLFGVESHVNSIPFSNMLDAKSDAQFKGEGTTNRSGTLTAFLAARVREVLPNGDLVIQGIKEVKINNERQMLSLMGIVRPQDISPNNIVASTNIANMQILLEGKGIVSENIRPGFLFKILSKFWPF
jgi:flagellar L-ring protein precursor FlgH